MIKDKSVYTIVFPNGYTLRLCTRALADVYISAYGCKLVSITPEN